MSELGRRISKIPFRADDHIRALLTGLKYLIKPRITLDYPKEMMEIPKGYRGYIYLIDKKCTGCGMCSLICPANSIKMVQVEERKRRPRIHYGYCIFCGFCVDVCPTEALVHTTVHDIAYYTIEEQDLDQQQFTIIPVSPIKDAKRVKAVLDEEVGIRYEPAD
jgi:NADH-quinone oxidoreductase subunit I